MATTQLQATATPGQVRTFTAKSAPALAAGRVSFGIAAKTAGVNATGKVAGVSVSAKTPGITASDE